MADDLKIVKISEIFNQNNYLVPIYQRNYAWTELEIIQLIEDIESSIHLEDESYFLGNLIVNQVDNNLYEVIDGQQRLTTLFLLGKYLDHSFPESALRFEAREKSNRTLSYIMSENKLELLDELKAPAISEGYEIIATYFKTKKVNKERFAEKLKQVLIVQVQVPQNIDLNHYFEIMNTRGEQLELHEIAKAKLLEVLETDEERNVAALIWEKCSNMNSYIQMNFTKKIREELFTKDWTRLDHSIMNFDSIQTKITEQGEETDKRSLFDILENNQILDDSISEEEEENKRFESTITFPNFLLQVNAILKEQGEEDSSLDDKNFLTNLEWTWQSPEIAKDFLFHLLKVRVLFDKFILKREYARDYKETGKWSLQALVKYRDRKRRSDKPKYLATLTDDGSDNKKLRILQSALRVTYTSPKTMHWITNILSALLSNENVDIISLLESYAMQKVIHSDYQHRDGFGFERIVFTYLDYLIYRDGYSYRGKEIIAPMEENWQFQFRSSIEHFYPQNPIEVEPWIDEDLNIFGNLALITVSGNSKFSNLPPSGKINSYPSIINQSLKLRIMDNMTRKGNGKWTKEKSKIHRDEMFWILENER